jgi:hypothetical protein
MGETAEEKRVEIGKKKKQELRCSYDWQAVK